MKTISFSQRTKELIGSMAKINQAMLFQQGHTQETWSAVKGGNGASVFVKATFEEDLPYSFGIHDLPKFLNILSLYKEAQIALNENMMLIKGKDGRSYQYLLTAPSLIYSPDVEIELTDPLAEFTLPVEELHTLNRTLSIANFKHVKFMGKNNSVFVVGISEDDKSNSSDIYAVKLGETDKKFNVIFNATKIQSLMENDYDVTISDSIVRFKGPDIVYHISPETDSTF